MIPIPRQLEVARPSSPAQTEPRAALSTSASTFNQFYAAQNGIRIQGPGAGLGLVINRRIAASRSMPDALNSARPGLRAGNQPGHPDVGARRKSDYLLILDSQTPFATKLMAELAAAGLQACRVSDTESAKQLVSRKSRPTLVLDLRYAALPLTAAFLIGGALAR